MTCRFFRAGCWLAGCGLAGGVSAAGIALAYYYSGTFPLLAIGILLLSQWAAMASLLCYLALDCLADFIPPFVPTIPPVPWPDVPPEDAREAPRDLLHPDPPEEGGPR